MIDNDEIAVWLSAGVLRGAGHEIEALNLEAMAEDAAPGGLGDLLDESRRSEQRGGALGLEIVGAIIVPALLEAARQFWAAYQKEFIEKAGKSAAEATLAQFKKWFGSAPAPDKEAIGKQLASAIRRVGEERKLKAEDIDALVAATSEDRLGSVLTIGK